MSCSCHQARPMTEDELLIGISGAAMRQGWRLHHHRRSDKAVQTGHRGLPDLVLARNGRVLFMELKDARGRLSEDQIAWLAAMGGPHPIDSVQALAGTAALVIRPAEYDAVLELLK